VCTEYSLCHPLYSPSLLRQCISRALALFSSSRSPPRTQYINHLPSFGSRLIHHRRHRRHPPTHARRISARGVEPVPLLISCARHLLIPQPLLPPTHAAVHFPKSFRTSTVVHNINVCLCTRFMTYHCVVIICYMYMWVRVLLLLLLLYDRIHRPSSIVLV